MRDKLGLSDPYKKTKQNLKSAGKGLKRLLKLFIIAGIIVAVYVINIALGGIFKPNIDKSDIDVSLVGKKIDVKLDKNQDPDTDGIKTGDELEYGTNPFNRDSDNDGVTDDGEINLGLDPTTPNENILIDAYNGIVNAGLSFNFGDFTLQAEDTYSRAYVSAVSENLPDGTIKTTFNHFKGIIRGEAFHKENGYSRKVKQLHSDGKREVFYTSPGDTVTTLNTFGQGHIIENGFLRGILNFFLPQSGAVSAFDNLKSDYSNDTLIINNYFNEASLEYAKKVTDNLSDERFNLLHIDPSYKEKLVIRLNNGEVVPVSIISDDNEYLLYITGQYNDGNFAICDDNGNTIKLILEKASRPLTDGTNFVQMEYLRFECGNINSDNGARLIFL